MFLSSLAGDYSQLNASILYLFGNDLKVVYIFSSILFITVILLSSLLKILFLRLNFNSAAHIGNEIGSLCFTKAISEDFENQQLVNSSVILNLLTVNVDATTAAINNLLLLTSSIASAITIVISIIALNKC